MIVLGFNTYRRPSTPCRACGASNDALTGRTGPGGEPFDGDCAVCWRCGEVSIIMMGPLGAALREPTLDELTRIHADHADLLKALTASRAHRGRQP